jgi:endonuclease/exonuclease/phosphatase family metal-dependent hydrolase
VENPHPEAKEPQRKPTSYFLGKGNVLDYIFISNHFNVNNYVVLDEHLQEHGNNLLLQSDHAQVVCELSFEIPKENI